MIGDISNADLQRHISAPFHRIDEFRPFAYPCAGPTNYNFSCSYCVALSRHSHQLSPVCVPAAPFFA